MLIAAQIRAAAHSQMARAALNAENSALAFGALV